MRESFESAARWGKENGRPIFLGEFGAGSKADMDSRLRWTSFVEEEARRLGSSRAYWEFCAGFGVYDREAGAWREPLKDALLGGAGLAAAGRHVTPERWPVVSCAASESGCAPCPPGTWLVWLRWSSPPNRGGESVP